MQRLSGPGPGEDMEHVVNERRERQVLTTLALLQTFHANTSFQLSRLASLIPSPPTVALVDTPPATQPDNDVIYITPKDILSFELGPLSSLHARYLEWLAEEYSGGARFVQDLL
ncbi:hypothetical protein BU15DRAFT_76592 [Melanogaster broomeanus]|nr:hypothetical protein BU15DRAFT_76592 [Melanogaster broomeanus]